MTSTEEATGTRDVEGAAEAGLEIDVQEGPGASRVVSVTVPADRMESLRARERSELGGSLNLKGFRPGKVPAKVVEKRYGEVVDERTARAAVDEAWREAVERTGLEPVARPEIRDVRYEEGDALTFRAEVEVAPVLELERIGGFRIDRPAVDVTDADVREVLDRLRDDHAVYAPVDRPPEEGDQVAVRITPLDAEGEPEEEEGEGDGDPYRFVLGEGNAIPDVEEAIRSLEPGETDDFRVSFPTDFSDEELAGNQKGIRVELLEVKARDLPELDDAFAAEVGDFESVDELRSAVLEDLRSHREEEAEEAVRRSLLDSIVEANPFDVPEAMVDRYLDRVIDAPPEADPEDVQEARRSLRPRAEEEVRRQMVIDHLMEREGFEATDEEVDARIREIADRRDSEPDEVRRQLSRSGRMEGLRHHLAVEKLFEDLKSRSGLD